MPAARSIALSSAKAEALLTKLGWGAIPYGLWGLGGRGSALLFPSRPHSDCLEASREEAEITNSHDAPCLGNEATLGEATGGEDDRSGQAG